MSAIQGINILEQSPIYQTSLFGIIFTLLFISLAILFFVIAFILDEPKLLILMSIFTIFAAFGGITADTNFPLINSKVGTKYIIQVEDENAWKEIVPNYEIVKRVYENQNIWEIKGDYVDESNH